MALSSYFNNFPRRMYSFDTQQIDPKQVINIFQKSVILKELLENTSVFYEYSVQDGDTPESIADKLYKDPFRAWIVLLFNQINNPYYEFPLDNLSLDKYIANKYNQTVGQSRSSIHHYEKESISTYTLNGNIISKTTSIITINGYSVDPVTGIVTSLALPTEADTYYDQTTEVSPIFSDGGYMTITNRLWAISNYTYELKLNEDKRTINLLEKTYVPMLEKEFKKLMQTGTRYG